MEGLEQRQLLAANSVFPTPFELLNTFSGPRNMGTIPAFIVSETEGAGTFGENDQIFGADFVPLGTAPGQRDAVDISGSLPITIFPNDQGLITDVDVYALDLRGGDILDIAAHGAAGSIDVLYGSGALWFGTETPQSIFYPADSPLQTLGNVVASQVVPEDGRYYLRVSPIDASSNYDLSLRAYRPLVEQLPIGTKPVIFLDFDGAIFTPTDFGAVPPTIQVRVEPFFNSLDLLGFDTFVTNQQEFEALQAIENLMIDKIIAEMEQHFDALANSGGNGDYDSTGVPGQYGVTILNSRDHADPALTNPGLNLITTRLLIGDTSANAGIDAIGISSTLDVGNFSMDDTVLIMLDAIVASTVDNGAYLLNNTDFTDVMSRFIGVVSSHEAGHSFGLRHTNGANFIGNIIDGVGPLRDLFTIGFGRDGIYGTLDDTEIEFTTDEFDTGEGLFGYQRTAETMAFTLATGMAGSAITGRVFDDVNRNGSGTGDSGIAGVTVFADINNNQVQDTGEVSTVTTADGTFSLGAPAGSYNVVAIPPPNFGASTPVGISANSGAFNFGFFRVSADATGQITDNNGNPIEDVYVYLDLDGDKRPDLGEPNTHTAADGSYSLNFPSPGIYTICVVVPPGFRQVTPATGGIQVEFNGNSIVQPGTSIPVDALFEFEASSDFGDAPTSYGDASHGIISGLSLGGSLVDSETGSQYSATATGDDTFGIDDEDGVSLIAPLAPGGSATFSVDVTNTTGTTAYLQAFMDFDGDGNFTDVGEQFAVNQPIVSSSTIQSVPVTISVPVFANIGTTFARFRLSQSAGVGATGFVGTGEVEDYTFSILTTTNPANDDPDATDPGSMTVSRNSTANVLDVLANDFQSPGNQLTIINLNTTATNGQLTISTDGKAVLYTPPNGFVGLDFFSYTVRDEFGITSTADVTVTVRFQSGDPIAVDDSFEVPEGSSNRALNVLENDVPSTAGGISVISVTSGSAGGFLNVPGGGQSIRYTPLPGFNGTEQFTYTIQDGDGKISSATGTVHLLPGATQDDIVQFSFDLLDQDGQSLNGGMDDITPSVRVGDTFQIRVSVDDLRSVSFTTPEGVASASLDVLYSSALVAVKDAIPGMNGGFSFDITFGQIFGGLQTGNASTPGLLDDVGAIQTSLDQVEHAGPKELFTVTMQATAPGVAQFIGDPSDDQLIETTVIGSDVGLTPSELGFDRVELLILPQSDNFTSAVEDSFPNGTDSNGNPISSGTALPAELQILDNDNLRIVNGQAVSITQFGLVTSPSQGTATINNNGTPSNLNDDFINYRPFINADGLEQFSYFIVDGEGSSSVAQVTIALGDHNATAQVAMDFQLVREDGTPINPAVDTISVGEKVGVQILLEDLKPFADYVAAGYLDVIYSNGILTPATDVAASLCSESHNGILASELDFSVCIGENYTENATSGSATSPGIINEFGSFFNPIDAPTGPNPALLATIFFDANAPGTAQITGSPADRLPESDTIVSGDDDPTDVSKIRFDQVEIQVVGSSLQNASFPQDVDADGEATALDALIIVNRLGDLINGQNPLAANGGFYTDVNGDSKITAIDALQVINYISRSRASGEAETQPQAVQAAPVSSPSEETDAAFAELAADDASKIVASSTSGGQLASVSPIIISDDDDDDDDDGLDLFADDVFGQWN